MQFLAFLRDSYREARSGLMLQLMFVLAAVLVALVASIGFRPVTVGDQLAAPLQAMTRLFAMNAQHYDQIGRPAFSVENVVPSNPAEPWRSDYAFDFVVTCPTPADMRKARQSGVPVSEGDVRHFLRDILRDFEKVTVAEDAPPAAAAHMALGGAVFVADPPWATAEARYHAAATGNKVDDPLAWPHQVSILFFYDVPFVQMSPRDGAYQIENWLVSGVGAWVALLVAVIITAGFVPSMMAKGSLDLLVSKPIGRSRLLVYKYVGGLTFVFVLTAATALGVWVAVGVRTGIRAPHFLAVIPILTFYFAILYAVSVTAAVFTRSTIVAILATGLAWVGFWAVGKVNDGIAKRLEQEAVLKANPGIVPAADGPDGPDGRAFGPPNPKDPLWGVLPKAAFPYATGLHAVTPRTGQLDARLGRVIAEGVLTPYQLKKHGYGSPPRESWAEMIGVSLGFSAVMLGLSCWRFTTRDY